MSNNHKTGNYPGELTIGVAEKAGKLAGWANIQSAIIQGDRSALTQGNLWDPRKMMQIASVGNYSGCKYPGCTVYTQ